MLHCEVCRKEKPLLCPACCMARTLKSRLAYLNIKLVTRQLHETISDLCVQKHLYRIKQTQNSAADCNRRLQDIIELHTETEKYTALKKTEIHNLRNSIIHRREALQAAKKVVHKDVLTWRLKLFKEMQEYRQEIPSLEAVTQKIWFRLVCEAAVITSLKFRRVHWPARAASESSNSKAVETREIITIGGVRIPDMSEFTQFNRRMINAVLERVVFLLCLMTDYMSFRLPHKLYLPNTTNSSPGIFDFALDQRIDLVIGSSHDRKHDQMSKISKFGRGILIERSRREPRKANVATEGKLGMNNTAGSSPVQRRSRIPSSSNEPSRPQTVRNHAKKVDLSTSPIHEQDQINLTATQTSKDVQQTTNHSRHSNATDRPLTSQHHTKTRVLQPLPAEAAAAVMRAARSGSRAEHDNIDKTKLPLGIVHPSSLTRENEKSSTSHRHGSFDVLAPKPSPKHSSSEKDARLIEGLALLAVDVAKLCQIFGIEITRKNFLDIGFLLYMGVKKLSTLDYSRGKSEQNKMRGGKDMKGDGENQSEPSGTEQDFPEEEWYDWAVSQLRTSIERDEWSMVEREDWT